MFSLSQPKVLIRLHRGLLASARPDGCVAMEMCDTFVMSCLFPDGHLHSFEKFDRPFSRIPFAQTGLSKGLAGSFVSYQDDFCAMCVSNGDRPGFVVVAVCFSFLRIQSQYVPPTQHWPASPGC